MSTSDYVYKLLFNSMFSDQQLCSAFKCDNCTYVRRRMSKMACNQFELSLVNLSANNLRNTIRTH